MRKDILEFFAKYIENELGMSYSMLQESSIARRIEEVQHSMEMSSVEDLYRYCKTSGIHGHTRQLLLDLASNNETQFFRNKKVFDMIKNHIFPKLHERNLGQINIYSLACSSGQEPYSIAIQVDELKAAGKLNARVDIDASDISSRMLETAKKGVYSQLQVQMGLHPKYLVKYFSKTEDGEWKLKDNIVSAVKFSSRNLLELLPGDKKYDLILCRNVLIYQSIENRKRVVNSIYNMMNDGGFFIAGASESMVGISKSFTKEDYEGAFCYRK